MAVEAATDLTRSSLKVVTQQQTGTRQEWPYPAFNGVPLWIAPQKKRALSGGAGAERRHTFVLQLRITTPHYGHLILQMAVYAL